MIYYPSQFYHRAVFSAKVLEINIISTFNPSDGIEVSSQLIQPGNLEWASGYPLTDIENRTCVSWDGYNSGSLKIKNTKCDASEDKSDSGIKTYYDKASGESYNENLLLRGYLCETRAIHTISAYERMVS